MCLKGSPRKEMLVQNGPTQFPGHLKHNTKDQSLLGSKQEVANLEENPTNKFLQIERKMEDNCVLPYYCFLSANCARLTSTIGSWSGDCLERMCQSQWQSKPQQAAGSATVEDLARCWVCTARAFTSCWLSICQVPSKLLMQHLPGCVQSVVHYKLLHSVDLQFSNGQNQFSQYFYTFQQHDDQLWLVELLLTTSAGLNKPILFCTYH